MKKNFQSEADLILYLSQQVTYCRAQWLAGKGDHWADRMNEYEDKLARLKN